MFEFTYFWISSLENPSERLCLSESRFNAEQGTHQMTYLTTNVLPRLKHLLLSKVGVSDDVLSGSVNDQLVKACTGKRFRGRLNGREFVSSTDGKIRIAAEFDLLISQNLFLLRRQILHLILQNILQN